MQLFGNTGTKSMFLAICIVTLHVAASSQSNSTSRAKPDTLIVAGDLSDQQKQKFLDTARGFYEFWNSGDPALLSHVISPEFIDRDLPPGRPQGPKGPLFAIQQFKKAVPDLRCEVLQQIIVADRVVSHLRFTGHFTGTFGKLQGTGQNVDFVATDILRVDQRGEISENWHLEDNLTFLKQIGAVSP